MSFFFMTVAHDVFIGLVPCELETIFVVRIESSPEYVIYDVMQAHQKVKWE